MLRSVAKVSILVVLDHWFGQDGKGQFQVGTRVSILVVLDHWFGHSHRDGHRLLSSGFQSLLFWIIGSGGFLTQESPAGSMLFQSLLFWIIGSGY